MSQQTRNQGAKCRWKLNWLLPFLLLIACVPSPWVGTTHVQNPSLSSVTPVWKCPHTLTEAFVSGDSAVNHTGQGRLTITVMLPVDDFSSLQPSMKMLLSFLLGH